MSYLLTGAPATTDPTIQSSSSQTTLATGTSLAVGAALGTIAGSAGQELGFDVVQILQDLQGAQTLVAGKYVSPDLYIGFRQPLSEVHEDDENPESVGRRDGVRGGVRGLPQGAAQPPGSGKRVPGVPPAPRGQLSCAPPLLVAALRGPDGCRGGGPVRPARAPAVGAARLGRLQLLGPPRAFTSPTSRST